MTIPATTSASPYGTPYPNSHLSAEARLELYVGMLDAPAKRSRERRAAKASPWNFEAEDLQGQTMKLIHMGEDTPTASGLRVVGGMA